MSGGGGSQATTQTDKSITTTTETTTNIGDIGFTGSDAVALAAVVEKGVENQTRAVLAGLEPLVQGVGQGVQQLVGGSNELVRTAAQTTERQQQIGARAIGIDFASDIDTTKIILIVAAGASAIAALASLRK